MINPTETNEKHYDYGEEKICKEFGCGRKLTLRESLFGDRCIKHSKYENKSNRSGLQVNKVDDQQGKVVHLDSQPDIYVHSCHRSNSKR